MTPQKLGNNSDDIGERLQRLRALAKRDPEWFWMEAYPELLHKLTDAHHSKGPNPASEGTPGSIERKR